MPGRKLKLMLLGSSRWCQHRVAEGPSLSEIPTNEIHVEILVNKYVVICEEGFQTFRLL